jgi:hypothetical protein
LAEQIVPTDSCYFRASVASVLFLRSREHLLRHPG